MKTCWHRCKIYGLAVWLAGAHCAFAHDPGLSTALLQLRSDKLEVTLTLAIADAAQLISSPLPSTLRSAATEDGSDGKGTKGEGSASIFRLPITNYQLPITNTSAQFIVPSHAKKLKSSLQQAAADALEIKFDNHLAKPGAARCQFDQFHNVNIYLSFPAPRFSELSVRSKWLARLPPGHREFLTLEAVDGETLAEPLLSANSDNLTVHLESANKSRASQSFSDFLLMGIKHIWTGYDHLLFLFGLLVVTRNFAASVKIITCFTIAHSITLAVATLSLVQISSRIVEPLIAASIVYVGVENLLRGGEPKGRWLLTFAFGLIHGFGFASVLRELGVGAHGGGGIVVPLISFNAGVEVGQIVIAALVLPILWKLRNNRNGFLSLLPFPFSLLRFRWVPATSVAIALLGSFWFIQRVCS